MRSHIVPFSFFPAENKNILISYPEPRKKILYLKLLKALVLIVVTREWYRRPSNSNLHNKWAKRG